MAEAGENSMLMRFDKMSTYSGSLKSKQEADFDKGDNSNYDIISSEGIDLQLDEPPETPAIGNPFRGMAKEELLRHSSKPFWRRLRMVCISIILLGWLALLITVVALVLVYPRCRDPDMRSWWQKETVYRVYVRSFRDSDGDGIGDLKGVESSLGYIQEIGANTVSLSPVYQSDQIVDSDFNVIDHMDIDRDYGNMDDFRSLLKAVHDRGMHLIMDFIPNHTSDRHSWFLSSSQTSNRSNDFRNYYVWSDSPTNWRTVYSNDSWSMSSQRKQSYFYQFLSSQPDLNIRSSQVQDALEGILQFWLSEGVDGFYIRNSGFMFEDYDLRDEKKSSSAPNGTDPDDYTYYDHDMTYGLPEVYDMLARWRTLVEEYSNTTERFLMADIKGDIKTIMSYYGHFDRDGVHIALNENFLTEHVSCGAPCVHDYVTEWLNNLPKHHWANWVLGNEDTVRLGSKYNATFIRGLLTTIMLLPGTPIVYYGDEIFMMDTPNLDSHPWTREHSMRGLMQWQNDTDGGFCSSSACSSPWIPNNGDFIHNNVQEQNRSADSLLNLFKKLTTLRQRITFSIGEYNTVVADDSIFSFVREFDGEKGYLVTINFSEETQIRNYHSNWDSIEKAATVELTTGSDVSYAIDDTVNTRSITLEAYQGIVVSWDYIAKEL